MWCIKVSNSGHNGWHDSRVSRSLCINTPYVNLKNDYPHCSCYKRFFQSSPLPTKSIILSTLIKSIVVQIVPFFSHFCIIFILTCWTCSRNGYACHICRWALTNQQSINHLFSMQSYTIYFSNAIDFIFITDINTHSMQHKAYKNTHFCRRVK